MVVAISVRAQDMVQVEVVREDTLGIYQVRVAREEIILRDLEALHTIQFRPATALAEVLSVAVAVAVVQDIVQIIVALVMAAEVVALDYTVKDLMV
jgi:hypothetical protein